MNILICNDDGYQAKGIGVLAEVASKFGNVRVVAPDRNRTAASHSLTLHKPLTIRQAENGFYYVSGTPTDCVYLALCIFDDFKPDWIFSGINHGANMGDDVLYSGTVASAMQGYLMGIPAIAFSLDDKSNDYWKTAEKSVEKVIERAIQLPIQKPVLWNVNIPKVQPHQLRGVKTVVLGQRHRNDSVIKSKNPYNETIYWIGHISDANYLVDNSDFVMNANGYVTITPLAVDLTNTSELKNVSIFFDDLVL
ncbi:MAG: 5'/3'-nucleotidase SurE [Neisseriaceae bacterium]|nr:MAG: 5'/3'-nucleotidase SurE [Neisseriaceae bacterium]